MRQSSTAQGTPVNIIVGSHVWVEDTALAWLDGLIEKTNGAEVEIQTSNVEERNRWIGGKMVP